MFGVSHFTAIINSPQSCILAVGATKPKVLVGEGGAPKTANVMTGRNYSLLFFKAGTTLQSVMNAKLSKHRFWHCHENGLIKMIQTIPHNLYLSFKLASLY